MEHSLQEPRSLLALFLLFGVFFHGTMCSDDNEVNDDIHQCLLKNSLACSINNFGASLMRIMPQAQNVFISPISIYTALAMTYLGTRGETAIQMEGVLQLQSSDLLNQTEFHTSIKSLLQSIHIANDDYSLLIANGAFIQQNFSISENYTNDIQNFYHSAVKIVDFCDEPEITKNIINRFVAEHTENMIPQLLGIPLDPLTVFALFNAVYFKGSWETRFPERNTMRGHFHINNYELKEVQFMNIYNRRFPYYANSAGDQYLELAYKNRNMSMLLVLPDPSNRWELMIMNAEVLATVKNNLRRKLFAQVTLPKFRLKYQTELIPLLQQLGMQDLFSSLANLKGISEVGGISVTSIFHQAIVDVNEQGSEAAAVTEVLSLARSFNIPTLYYFIADRPFAFYIIDNRNDLVLFSGRAYNP